MAKKATVRGVVRGLVAVLAASLLPAVVIPSVAVAAGPSQGLPEIKPVPVQPQPTKPRDEDEASRRGLAGDQEPRVIGVGAGVPTATSLSPSATWGVSTHSGDFTWSYPLRVPPAPGGLVPDLTLDYRSSNVDGRTSVTNNQPSWIGDGWDLSPGFIERSYGSCVDDDVQTADLCWRTDNATASYTGGGGLLICCDDKKRWRAKNDDGSRIERLWGAANGDEGSGTEDRGEHWKITTVNGTQFFFGSLPDAKSTWTVPVFGDDANEPCNRGAFASSSCQQAWRWNLDKIVDASGNVIRYFYETESNKYGRNMNKDDAVTYIRGGMLHHIDYGMNERVNAAPSGRVEFTLADRCVKDSICTHDKKDNWPDTALDAKCDAAPCKELSPSFWSTKRLSSVTTFVRRDGNFDPVDRWTLDQTFPDPGDGEKPALWLKSITHTGLAGNAPDVDLPAVTFEGHQMPNRVYSINDGYAMLNRYRVTGIVSETGGVTSINYKPAQCSSTNKPANAWTNEMLCFPVKWAPPKHEERTDYFHKYVVERIIQSDELSSSIQAETSYEYLDGAAWHWDQSDLAKDKKKTWNEFRGFKRVRVRTGAPQDRDPGGSPMTMAEHRFYRGMDGDRLNESGGTEPAEVQDSIGGKRTDLDWLLGFGFESTVYAHEAPSPSEPQVVSRTISDPVWQGPFATRGVFKSYFVGSGTERVFTPLESGGVRETKSITEYDDRGQAVELDELGDVNKPDDDRCTTTKYARNEDLWLMNRPHTIDSVSVNCSATARFPANAITAGRFSYDDRGNLVKTEIAKDWPAKDGQVYSTTATANYDEHGRTTESTNALGAVSRIEFTPRTGGPTTGTTVTSPTTPTLPGGLVTRATLEPANGQQTKTIDPNGRETEVAYDALGRTTAVWLPNRPRKGQDGEPDNPRGSVEYGYQIRRGTPTAVTTTMVGPHGIHVSNNTLYDGLLRPRQLQTPAVGMRDQKPVEQGRLIVDTRYDSHGRAYKTTQPYFNDAAVDTNFWVASDTEVPGLTRTTFDGAGRPAVSTYQAGALDRWATITSYGGDRVHVTPPTGGVATTTITDARDRKIELREHHGPKPEGSYDSTRYGYTTNDQLAEVIGPDGARWAFKYDLRGRKISSTDPDSGTATLGYDDAGQLISSMDARGQTLAFAYDALGRKTSTHKGTLAGPKLAQWTFDTAPFGKGLAATSTRYAGADLNHAYIASVGGYTALNKPTKTSITIPPVEGLLAGTYETSFGFGADGSVTGETYPKVGEERAGGLPEETVNYGMDNWGRPTSTETAAGEQLVANTLYTRYGELERVEHGVTGKRAWQSFYYDTSTRRLDRIIVDAEVPKPMQADLHYTYDPAGNVTSIADLTIGQTPDIQCVKFDHVRRLTDAWTAPGDNWLPDKGCTAAPNQTTLSGPAPYWHSYTYDAGGNRRTETQRTVATSVTRTYHYPAAGQPQPHTLRSVTGPSTETYDYNVAGATTRRVKPGADETFNWNAEGHLESVVNTTTNETTAFLYTPDGGRLLRKDATGTTLYLGKQELRLAAGDGKPTAIRYYVHAGHNVAMRQGNKALTWLANDHQSTAQIAIDTGPETMTVTRRRQLPFGAPRGDSVVWPDDRGFVGGTVDASIGLTLLGAREYDTANGRFITVDPIMDLNEPQQFNGYSYASNNPFTRSDPTGLSAPDGECARGCPYKPGKGPASTCCNTPTKKKANGGYSGGGTYRNNPNYQQPGGTPLRTGCGGRGSCAPNGTPPISTFAPPPPTPGFPDCEPDEGALQHGVTLCKGTTAPNREAGHLALDACGSSGVPVASQVCDIGNAIGYATELDLLNALISVFGLVPGIGDGATAVRAGDNLANGAKTGCSFDGDTEVMMADGTTKPISEVKEGDQVLAADPKTGEKGPRKVTAVMVHDDTVLDLVTADGSKVTTTEDHPFWNATDKQWQPAGRLDSGDNLVTATGQHLRVTGLLPATAAVAHAYNLTVADIHTYFVVVGPATVLVHNSCPADGPPRGPNGGLPPHVDRWSSPHGASQADHFETHYKKHGEPKGKTREQYAADAAAWADGNPARGMNSSGITLADGTKGVKYTKPGGGIGGMLDANKNIVSFWYD